MNIVTRQGVITVIDEPSYTFDSADNLRSYAREFIVGDDGLSSVHGVMLNDTGVLVIGAGGGGTGVHAHCARVIDDKLVLAVGNQVACMSLIPPMTCYGPARWMSRRVSVSIGRRDRAH
jgi:hypothetical protein